jgi:hypothetical protein
MIDHTITGRLRNLVAATALGLSLAGAQARDLALQLVAQGLVSPIQLDELPDGSGRKLIVQQDGVVRVLLPDGHVAAEPLLDLRPHMLPVANDFEERGLLGLALHPQFARNGRLFITYSAPLRPSAPRNWNYTRRVSELSLKPGTLGRVLQIDSRIISLAEDRAGEIYVLTHEGLGPYGNTGKVFRLVGRP